MYTKFKEAMHNFKPVSFLMSMISICLILETKISTAAKILLMPGPSHSHYMQQLPIGEVLAIEYGHDVHVLSHRSFSISKHYIEIGIKPFYFGENKPFIFFEEKFQKQQLLDSIEGTSINPEIIKAATDEMINVYTDEKLSQALKNIGFDFAIVDGLFYFRYFLVIAHRLKVPFGCVMSFVPPDMPSEVMRLPSIDPSDETDLILPMNFLDRFRNIRAYLFQSLFIPRLMSYDEFPSRFSTTDNPFDDIRDLAMKSLFWIVDRSEMLIPAVPKAPNVFVVGAVSTKPLKKLPKEVQFFADEASNGLVIVSFGSIVTFLDAKYLNEMVIAFGKMKNLRFIMRLAGKLDVPIPSNVKVMSWLPQNDLLGHNNTKIFITHCGNNGITEALTNGVPMIGMPIQWDQPFNCKLMKSRGYGEILKLCSYTSDDMIKTIDLILSNPSYYQNTNLASMIIKSQPNPANKAADIVDHVIKFGGDHLRNSGRGLYWFQILMWDFALMIFIGLLILFYFVIYIVQCCFCRRSKEKVQ